MSDRREPPRLRRLSAVAALVFVAAAFLGACGGDDEDDTAATDPTTTETAAPDDGASTDTTEAPDAGGGTEVEVKDFQFDPETITVSAGDTVTWKFEDAAPHNVTHDDFESENLTEGEEFSHTFDDAGTFEYECTLHPGMTGTVEVQ